MALNASNKKHQPPESRRERFRVLPGGWWLWCLVGVGIGLAGWLAGRQHLKKVLANQLAEAQSELDAMQSIDALLRLDGDATVEVSRGLAHPEFMVANAAYRALNKQLDAWGQLEDAERLRRMQQVMTQLESMPAAPDYDHQILIDGLISRIYAQALASREVGVAELLATCKELLKRDNKPSQVLDARQDSWSGERLPGEVSRQQVRDSAETDVIPPPLDSATAPDAQLPPVSRIDREALPQAEPVVRLRIGERTSVNADGQSASRMPQLSSSSAAPSPLGTGSGRALVQLTATPAVTAEPGQTVTRDPAVAQVPSIELSFSDDPSDALAGTQSLKSDEIYSGDLTALESLPIEQLVRLLAHVDSRVAQAAAFECKRKGLTDDKLVMAVQLAQGSSAERQQVLQALVRRDDLDPRPWLLWMAEEGDSRTRIQALGLLYPLLDNDLRRQLRLMLNRERDDEAAQAIRRLLAQ